MKCCLLYYQLLLMSDQIPFHELSQIWQLTKSNCTSNLDCPDIRPHEKCICNATDMQRHSDEPWLMALHEERPK